jgi:hypothetical protein
MVQRLLQAEGGGDRRHDGAAGGPGKALRVDTIKPTLKPPGINLFTLKYDISLSTFAFKLNLRSYSLVPDKLTELVLRKAG